MHKDHKILIYTTTRVLTLIFLANAYAESPMDEDTMVYRPSAVAQNQFEEANFLAGKGISQVHSTKGDFEVIDPKKSIQKAGPIELLVEEALPKTPQAQAEGIVKALDEVVAETPPMRTIAGFTLDDVKEMAQLACLSYTGTFDGEDGKALATKLKSEGWEIIEFSTAAERSGIVLVRGGEAIVSYHGTESLRNLATDAYGLPVEMEWGAGQVHAGFLYGFEKTWDQVFTALKTHATKQGFSVRDMKIKVTGHSLGAALATLAAYRLANVTEAKVEVLNFASPRVFDQTGADSYKKLCPKSLRVVHHDSTTGTDPVSLVGPKFLGYEHIGEEFVVKDGGATPHVMGGYNNALAQFDEDKFVAQKMNNTGWLDGFYSWLHPVNGDRDVSKGIVRVSHIVPDKWVEVQSMVPEERKAFLNMRQAFIDNAREVAVNKLSQASIEADKRLLAARFHYEIVRDQHLDITSSVRKARHEANSRQNALNGAVDKLERRQTDLMAAVDHAEEKFNSKKVQKEVEKKRQKLSKQKEKVEKVDGKLNTAKILLAEKRAKAAHKKFGGLKTEKPAESAPAA